MTAHNFDGNVWIDGMLVVVSLFLGVIFVWEALALTLGHLGGGVLWRTTLSELVMRWPIFGAAIIAASLFFLGWLTGHWWDAVRSLA